MISRSIRMPSLSSDLLFSGEIRFFPSHRQLLKEWNQKKKTSPLVPNNCRKPGTKVYNKNASTTGRGDSPLFLCKKGASTSRGGASVWDLFSLAPVLLSLRKPVLRFYYSCEKLFIQPVMTCSTYSGEASS